MGDRESLLELQSEIQQIGQEAYLFEQSCPQCQMHFQDYWQRLDWIDTRLQSFLRLEEENTCLRYRIHRYLDCGEPLDYL